MTNYRHGQMIRIIDGLDSSLLAVKPDRCLLVRHRNADCLRCADVCTTGAIALSEEGIVVSPEKCIGCGTCASACPTGCLTAANPTDEALFATVKAALVRHDGRVAIACETACARAQRDADGESAFAPGTPVGTADDGRAVIGVVCLGRVDESLLVEATARGARSIQLISGRCEACPRHCGGALCDEITASAENLLAAVGSSSPLERIRLAGAKPRTARKPAPDGFQADLPEPRFTHVQADGTLPHFVPERRLRLFNSLKALGTPVRSTVSTRLWGQVTIDTELCRSCRMCAVFCPTGALARFDGADNTFGVEHRSALCMQCRLCETICPEQAITVAEEVSTDEFLAGTKFRFAMQPIGWNPGAEDSIASRMARFIKVDNVQEPQAKVKSNDTAERRAYAHMRDERRREIREERGSRP